MHEIFPGRPHRLAVKLLALLDFLHSMEAEGEGSFEAAINVLAL